MKAIALFFYVVWRVIYETVRHPFSESVIELPPQEPTDAR